MVPQWFDEKTSVVLVAECLVQMVQLLLGIHHQLEGDAVVVGVVAVGFVVSAAVVAVVVVVVAVAVVRLAVD